MRKLLIANRGEIAVRILRAARDHGLKTVAVYAEADAGALHAALADEAFGLGPGPAGATYLDIGKLIDIARRSGADAVHPGYGFLSERADFARAVEAAGLVWVGPSPGVIELLGDKIAARALARRVGAPLAAGSDGPVADGAAALAEAQRLGLPVAIKAAHGGGGRGIRVARDLAQVPALFEAAVREAEAAFGRGACYIEQFLDQPRHVEAQILADGFGRVAVLGTRDCSVQRRAQKLVEEAPAPFLAEAMRARIEAAAAAICREAGYTGAGTVEFLLAERPEGMVLSFLEVNTRLQVEHTVTEEIFGIDIVRAQLGIAEGRSLAHSGVPDPLPAPRGHALEFRINAEDPGRGFLPGPGRITRFRPPAGPGVRLDSGVEAGGVVPALYDSQMAKLIVTGADRAQAIARARRALAEFDIGGVPSTLPFHRALLESPAFLGPDAAEAGQGFAVHTLWAETAFPGLAPHPRTEPDDEALLRLPVEIDGRRHLLGLPAGLIAGLAGGPARITGAVPAGQGGQTGAVLAETGGILKAWLAQPGARVERGEPLALVEAMKTESRILAPVAGRFLPELQPPADLSPGQLMARIEADGPASAPGHTGNS